MPVATLHVNGNLTDFLPAGRRHGPIAHPFDGHPGVKDAIEALGIPHPEVDLILVNAEPAGFERRLHDGDTVAIYPARMGPDVPVSARVGPPALGEPRFVVDGHLGRLAAYLRMLGFDTWYRNHAADEELARTSARDDRILLTRDRGLLKRSVVVRGAFIRSDRPREQLAETGRRFDLAAKARPFTRCIRCNGVLAPADRPAVEGRVPPFTFRTHDEYGICGECGWVYWKGTHHERMSRLIAATFGGPRVRAAEVDSPVSSSRRAHRRCPAGGAGRAGGRRF